MPAPKFRFDDQAVSLIHPKSLDDMNKITPSLDVLLFLVANEEARDTRCPNCASFLTIIQPDRWLPDRLIGACEDCKHWFLIDIIQDANVTIMLRLPDEKVVRNLTQGNPSDGISLRSDREDTDSAGGKERGAAQQ